MRIYEKTSIPLLIHIKLNYKIILELKKNGSVISKWLHGRT